MQLRRRLDLVGIEVGNHGELIALPEQRARPAIGRDLLREPGVRHDRKTHVREVRGLMREDAQVVVTGCPRPCPQLVHDVSAEALAAALVAYDQGPYLCDRLTQWGQLTTRDDGPAAIDPDDEALDASHQLTQLTRQKMAGLLMLLNQFVNAPRVAPDGRPQDRRATPRGIFHIVAPVNTSLKAASSRPIA
jgi:hypothetical protein